MSIASRWEQARRGAYQARIHNLTDNEKWSEALTAVIDFAQWAQGRIDDTEFWLHLTVQATEIVGHLDDSSEYRAFLVHFADPFLGDERTPPPELLEALASISDHADPAVMISVGRWLTDARPKWPLGPYLIAHFTEWLERRNRPDGASITESQGRTAADQFQLAAERAGRAGLEAWRLHARLRQGSHLLITGTDRARGRAILGDIDWTQLQPTEQLWMAVSLASSGHWSDRVRAMDIILDLHRAVANARPRYRRLNPRDLRRAAATIFKLAGLHLPESESRRLDELSQALFRGDDRRQWKNFLQSRRKLSKVAALPLDQSDEVFTLLDKLSAVYPQRWQPTTRRFRILHEAWSGAYASTEAVPSPRRSDARLPIADAISALIAALGNADADLIGDHLRRLVDVLAKVETNGDAGSTRPIALVWPRLFQAGSEVDLDDLKPDLTLLAQRYAAIAPAPSYGWWTLAARLFEAGLDDAAEAIAEQALASDEDGDAALQRYVATRIFQSSIKTHDPQGLRRWIDAL